MDFLRGTCPLPNWILDELMWVLSGEEMKVVTYVARRTRGFQRESARITLRQFAEGTRGEDGELLDRGTGLSRDTVKRLLPQLKRLGVVAELAPNNALNEGPEYALPPQAEVDWGALYERRAAKADSAAVRCERARESKGTGCGTTRPGQVVGHTTPSGSGTPLPPGCGTSDPHGSGTTTPSGCATTSPAGCGTTRPGGACEERNPGETQVKARGEVETGSPEGETGDPGWCRPLLESLGVSEALITYLCRDPRRCYWAAQWATWWPSVAARVGEGQMNRFIQNRVKGAVAGRDEDRQPPAEWWDFEAERRKATQRQAASRLRDAERDRAPETRFGPGAEPLFRGLAGALDGMLRAHLACAESAAVEDGELVIRFRKSANQQWLERRSATVLGRVREMIPSFPAVRFELVKEGGRGGAR